MSALAEVIGRGSGGDDESPWIKEALVGREMDIWLKERPFLFCFH
jgi:hypothetical protein